MNFQKNYQIMYFTYRYIYISSHMIICNQLWPLQLVGFLIQVFRELNLSYWCYQVTNKIYLNEINHIHVPISCIIVSDDRYTLLLMIFLGFSLVIQDFIFQYKAQYYRYKQWPSQKVGTCQPTEKQFIIHTSKVHSGSNR